MDKNRSQNRLIYPYLILAIALVCAVLIVSYLWSNVNQVVVFPWEGPTSTPTLWWRTPQVTPPTPRAAAGFSNSPTSLILKTPSPAMGTPLAGSVPEVIDG